MRFRNEQFLCQQVMNLKNKKVNEINMLDLIFPS